MLLTSFFSPLWKLSLVCQHLNPSSWHFDTKLTVCQCRWTIVKSASSISCNDWHQIQYVRKKKQRKIACELDGFPAFVTCRVKLKRISLFIFRAYRFLRMWVYSWQFQFELNMRWHSASHFKGTASCFSNSIWYISMWKRQTASRNHSKTCRKL